ncbi:hypothetical protein BD410DRAFT_836977 [Rickenella mellea]|uniref:Calcofluor white hypersensitive protein n=1 Tax=Rickenella mellea TaxID=50990 RepID=A0A4Y7QDK2_9AGAM|nr:hypothetical protein BD410DRAFT_836977 [Rickenella mellea]
MSGLQPQTPQVAGRNRPVTIRASTVAKVHTFLALLAFLSALVVGCLFHYRKIVKNGVAGYPQEWFPSVSAAIGDWYPERSVFQILIALTSGPRFMLVYFQYYLTRSPTKTVPWVVFVSGLIRTVSCGGWVYITSNDDHDAHDVLMITYILFNIPWMFGSIGSRTITAKAQTLRKAIALYFFASIAPMGYFFVQHKVHKVPGAYTHYAFFEWGLIIADILFDSVNVLEFSASNLQITLSVDLPAGAGDVHDTAKPVTVDAKGSIESDPVTSNVVKASPEVRNSASHTALKLWKDLSGSFRPVMSFSADVYLAYMFWSILTSLAPALFYFSVWELGIAGHELALLSVLSPVLLYVQEFDAWAKTPSGRTTLHALSLTGLLAYKLNLPLCRLIVVAFANATLCIVKAVDWSDIREQTMEYQSILLGLGLILSSLSKHANHGNNPVWPFLNEMSGGYNKTGITLAVLAILELSDRNFNNTSTNRKDASSTASKQHSSNPQMHTTGLRSLCSALSFGSLMFSLHCLLSDSSTLITWSWTGYPIRGPVPHLHGALTIIAQAVGIFLPLTLVWTTSSKNPILLHPAWFACGCLCTFVTYSCKDWLGYFGGLGLAIFLMSISPYILLHAATSGKTAKVFFVSWLVTVLLYLANVWTVAYAFVPGGVYLRERSDLVLMAQILMLAPSFAWPKSALSSINSLRIESSTRTHASSLLALISVCSMLVTMFRMPMTTPLPYNAGPRIINAGVWTLHFGIDNQGRDSQRRVRDLIMDMKLDVVGLLETDLNVSFSMAVLIWDLWFASQRIVFGNRDLTRVAIEELGYFVDIGPGPNQHTWGAVLLSKFPIIRSTHHLLPSPHGELAPAISAVLDVWGTEVMVVVAHNGQEEDPLDRELQSKELARIMAEWYPNPVIFLGYVVTKPHALRPSPYEILTKDGRVHDIDSLDYDRWCEYIFYRGLYRTSYGRISRSTITDTELQFGQFVVPRHGHSVIDDSDDARYLRARKEELPTSHWFPMEYYGTEDKPGKNGHYYHVFFTPLYYRLPEGAAV